MPVKMIISLSMCAMCLEGSVKNGKTIYEVNCANCHSINMSGGMGKDFNLVSYARKKEDIKAYVQNPSGEFRRFGYTSNAMPKFDISDEDATDVAEFIDSLQPFKEWMRK
jgi:mono/diheme cytochrome c family protein